MKWRAPRPDSARRRGVVHPHRLADTRVELGALVREQRPEAMADLLAAGRASTGDFEPMLERATHFLRGLEPLARLAGERAGAKLGEPRIDVWNRLPQPRRRLEQQLLDRLHRRSSVEEPPSGEHLPEDDADGEDVDASIERLAARLLRGKVGDLPLDDADLGGSAAVGRLRDPEVDELHLAVVGQE